MASEPPATSDPNTSNQLSIRFDTRKMLELVRDNNHLWQVTHPDYHNTQLRQEVWYDIARRLDCNFELLQETEQKRGVVALIRRWKSARDSFFHSMHCKRPYVYENELKFVLGAYGAWQCVPIKTESLSEDGVANASDLEQSRAYGDTVREHYHSAASVEIKDENSEEQATDGKTMPTPPQTAFDDAAEVGESSSKPHKRKRMKSPSFDKEETLQTSMDNDTEMIHRGEKQTTSDDRATPERRSADDNPEVHQKSRKKKTKKSRNSYREAPPLSTVSDTRKVGKAHKKKKNKATNGFESVATLKEAVDEAAAEIYLQEPRKIRKKRHTNSEAEATLQSDSVSDTAGADHMCNSQGMKTKDVGQAFFNKIKPTVRMLNEDQKFTFRIEVLQLLKEIKIRRNSNSTQNSSMND